MKSLKALTDHLRILELIGDDAFDSWVEEGRLEYSGADITVGDNPSKLLYRLSYVAVFSWESWHGSAYELFAVVIKWLVANNYDFDVYGWPVFNAAMLDDETVDLQITINFEDSVYEQDGKVVDQVVINSVSDISVCGIG